MSSKVIVIVIAVVLAFIAISSYMGGIAVTSVIGGNFPPPPQLMEKEGERGGSSLADRTITYSKDGVSETRTLQEIWSGEVPPYSVFSPFNSNWYFNLVGENKDGLVFSTHWRTDEILNTMMRPLGNADSIYITLATNQRSDIPVDVLSALKFN